MSAASAIKNAIDALADSQGTVTPDSVVAAAKNPNSVLHDHFEWNDARAAHQHRLEIARYLIRSVHYYSVDRTDRTISQINYVHDPRTRSQGYITLRSAADNKVLQTEIQLAEVMRLLAQAGRTHEVFVGLGNIRWEPRLMTILKSIAALHSDMSSPAAPPRRKPQVGGPRKQTGRKRSGRQRRSARA